MMLAVLVGSKAEMAAGLASDGVAELAKRLGKITSRQIAGKPLYGNNFLADVVKADDLRSLPLLEVTTNRIAHLSRQFGEGIRFGRD
jgi:hypothetical protein